MEDFDLLLSEAKKRNMYIIMDLVINHCSDQHEWFQKALQNPEGEYGDYFYFRKGKNGNPPSNYRSYFDGSAWEKVKETDYYYLHMFAKEQPVSSLMPLSASKRIYPSGALNRMDRTDWQASGIWSKASTAWASCCRTYTHAVG